MINMKQNKSQQVIYEEQKQNWHQLSGDMQFENLKQDVLQYIATAKNRVAQNQISNLVGQFFQKLQNTIKNSQNKKQNPFFKMLSNRLFAKQDSEEMYNQLEKLAAHQVVLSLEINKLLLPLKNLMIDIQLRITSFHEFSETIQNKVNPQIKQTIIAAYKSNEQNLSHFNYKKAIYCVFLRQQFDKEQQMKKNEDEQMKAVKDFIQNIKDQDRLSRRLSYVREVQSQFINLINRDVESLLHSIDSEGKNIIDMIHQEFIMSFLNVSKVIFQDLHDNHISIHADEQMDNSFNQGRQSRYSTSISSNNFLIKNEIIVWIDSGIERPDNRENLNHLKKKFQKLEVHAFKEFNDFLKFISDKKEEIKDENNDFQIQQKRNLLQRRNSAINLLDGLESQIKLDEFDDDSDNQSVNQSVNLGQSIIWNAEVCEALISKNKAALKYYLILSGRVAVEVINRLPTEVRSVAIYCIDTKKYQEHFRNDKRIAIISQKLSYIIENIKKQQNSIKEIYNCKYSELEKYFTKRNPLEYISLTAFSVDVIEQKSINEITQMIKDIKVYYLNVRINIDIMANSIHTAFASAESVLKLYTKNKGFYSFINHILSRINEDALVCSSYIITTLRQALYQYQDDPNLFNSSSKVYRGIEINADQFLNDYPIGTKFVNFTFSSGSLDKNTAMQYTQINKFIFEISFNVINKQCFEQCRPKHIYKISQFQDENEVLFNCFSSFVVKGQRKEDGFTFVQLEFLENPVL